MQGVSEASRAPGRESVLCTTSASALDRDKGKVLDPRRMRCILPYQNRPEKSGYCTRSEKKREGSPEIRPASFSIFFYFPCFPASALRRARHSFAMSDCGSSRSALSARRSASEWFPRAASTSERFTISNRESGFSFRSPR